MFPIKSLFTILIVLCSSALPSRASDSFSETILRFISSAQYQEAYNLLVSNATENDQAIVNYWLSEFYQNGWVIKKNIIKSERLLKEAAHLGSHQANTKLGINFHPRNQ